MNDVESSGILSFVAFTYGALIQLGKVADHQMRNCMNSNVSWHTNGPVYNDISLIILLDTLSISDSKVALGGATYIIEDHYKENW